MMAQRASYRLTPRILVPTLGGGLYFVIAHYVFSYSDAGRDAVAALGATCIFLILQYLFQRFPSLMVRVLITILAAGLTFLIAHFVFSYSDAARLGIIVALASIGFILFPFLSR